MSGDTVVVPDDHRVDIRSIAPVPGLATTSAGIWVASFGLGSDELDGELEKLLADVDACVLRERREIPITVGPRKLSDLFARGAVDIGHVRGLLIWTLDAEALAGAPRAERPIQKWMKRLHRIRESGLDQIVYAPEATSPRAKALAALVVGMNVSLRTPAAKGEVLAEVHRPDGSIVAALLGELDGTGPDTWEREINVAKAAADRAGDEAARKKLVADERVELAKRMRHAEGQPAVASVDRAPRLHRLLRAAADDADALPALYAELFERTIPLLVIVDPKTMAGALRNWPGGKVALAVYPDRFCLQLAAKALGMADGSYAGAEMTAQALCAWAAPQDWVIALNTYRDETPLYVPLERNAVLALAEGKQP